MLSCLPKWVVHRLAQEIQVYYVPAGLVVYFGEVDPAYGWSRQLHCLSQRQVLKCHQDMR